MKAALALLLAASPAIACDWQTKVETDPMTDERVCWVSSASAEISFVVRGTDRPNISAGSAYPRPSVTVRVDDNDAVRMGNNGWTRTKALDALLPQIQTGTRIRTVVEDYPTWRNGDAPICNLPELLATCAK